MLDKDLIVDEPQKVRSSILSRGIDVDISSIAGKIEIIKKVLAQVKDKSLVLSIGERKMTICKFDGSARAVTTKKGQDIYVLHDSFGLDTFQPLGEDYELAVKVSAVVRAKKGEGTANTIISC